MATSWVPDGGVLHCRRGSRFAPSQGELARECASRRVRAGDRERGGISLTGTVHCLTSRSGQRQYGRDGPSASRGTPLRTTAGRGAGQPAGRAVRVPVPILTPLVPPRLRYAPPGEQVLPGITAVGSPAGRVPRCAPTIRPPIPGPRAIEVGSAGGGAAAARRGSEHGRVDAGDGVIRVWRPGLPAGRWQGERATRG